MRLECVGTFVVVCGIPLSRRSRPGKASGRVFYFMCGGGGGVGRLVILVVVIRGRGGGCVLMSGSDVGGGVVRMLEKGRI